MPRRSSAGLRTVEFGETLGLDGQDAKMGFMWALEAAIAMGDRAKAEEIMERIEAIPPGLRPPSLGAHVNRARARLADSGERGEMHAAVAATTFRELGLRFWAAVAQVERAELLRAKAAATRRKRSRRRRARCSPSWGAALWIARADAVSNRASAEAVG